MTTRRAFLIGSGLLALGAATGAAEPAPTATGSRPARLTMIIDQDRCTGCRSCEIACKVYTATAPQYFNTHLRIGEEDTERGGHCVFTPVMCNQCDDPPCVAACMAGATFKLASGIVVTDWDRCTACGACIAACPYDARFADPRFGGRADKCDFCLDRVQRDQVPACVEACSAGARLFGDLNDPRGEFASCLRHHSFRVRRPELGTGPNVLYVRRRQARDRARTEVGS